jgi:molybdopterin adenylyltransferase
VKVAVITVSDRAARGDYQDLSGPEIVRILKEHEPELELVFEIVPDDRERILAAFARFADADWIITSGGTGPAPRDVTPEATRAWIDRELPGISEVLRTASLAETPYAVFSRAVAGMRGRQYLVNLPGSVKAARLGAGLLGPLLAHGLKMAGGGGH